MIPYKFDEAAAGNLAKKLGSAAASAIQFRGKYKAAPLVAKEAEEKTAKDTADKKAKTEAKAAAATSARATKRKEELDQFQAKTDITTKARIKVKQTQTPAQKLAAEKAKAAKAAKDTSDNTSVGKPTPGVIPPSNPDSTNKPKKPRTPSLDPAAAERYTN